MSCLDATFTLTPRSPWYQASGQQFARLSCFGPTFYAGAPWDMSALYTTDRFFFSGSFNADPNLNYSLWTNLRLAPRLRFDADLSGFGTGKSLALVFGFDADFPSGQVQVYSAAGKLADRTLLPNDNQLLFEIESLDQPVSLCFIHTYGDWFFRGISGYVV